jgi:biotin transport system substrate-specific component
MKVIDNSIQAITPVKSFFAADVLAVAGLMYLGALVRIPLPFTPAPLTLQTFVVLAVPFLVGRERALCGIAAYILLGLTAHMTGVAMFALASGATYGYLAGFLLAPVVMARFPRSNFGVLAAMFSSSAIILLLGTFWLQVFLGISFGNALIIGALPFIPGDAIKLLLAWALVSLMNRTPFVERNA